MTTKHATTDPVEELKAIMKNGSEAEARAFITDNFNRFPEDMQEKITLTFFEEAVLNQAAEVENIANLQKEGTSVFKAVEKEKKELEDEEKMLKIKKDLGV